MKRTLPWIVVLSAGLLAAQARRAEAGCICPSLGNVRVGDLVVKQATVRSQTWTVAPDHVQVELALAGVSAATTIDVLAMGIPDDDHKSFVELAKLNSEPGEDVKVDATGEGLRLTSKTSKPHKGGFHEVRSEWKVAEGAPAEAKVKLSWQIAPAGDDAPPHKSKERVRDFCIDAEAARGMKRADGFHRVDLVVSEAMASGLTLQVERGPLPISFCAASIEKRPKTLVVTGRENLKDQQGVLPILFAEAI